MGYRYFNFIGVIGSYTFDRLIKIENRATNNIRLQYFWFCIQVSYFSFQFSPYISIKLGSLW